MTKSSTPSTIIPEGNKTWVSGAGVLLSASGVARPTADALRTIAEGIAKLADAIDSGPGAPYELTSIITCLTNAHHALPGDVGVYGGSWEISGM